MSHSSKSRTARGFLALGDSPSSQHESQKHASLVKTVAAMSWFVCAICCIKAFGLAISGPDGLMRGSFFLGVAGGAGYLGAVLPRKVVSAWLVCRRVAAAVGTVNMVVLPSIIVACAIGIGVTLWRGGDVPVQLWATTLAAAGVATATPWAFYHLLGDERVRSCFCAVDCR